MQKNFALWNLAALLLAAVPAQAAPSLDEPQATPGPGISAARDAEDVIWLQADRIAHAARLLTPGQAGRPDVFFVGFAGDDSQEIFAREVQIAAAAVSGRLGLVNRSLLLLNNREANASGAPIASVGTLRLALEELSARMDPAEDVLFLYLTSHGLPTNELYVSNGELPLEQLSPARLRELLGEFAFRRKIVVVSACFSGEFARQLADESTVVLTASRADRPSFGCRDNREMTYFGEALWNFAMSRADTLHGAFALALERVDEMEAEAALPSSMPQMFVSAQAHSWLDRLALKPAGLGDSQLAAGWSGRLAGTL